MRRRFTLFAAALCLSACATTDGSPAPTATATPIPAPKTEQWLYGSAESQVAMRQGWDSIAAYGEYVAANRPQNSVFVTITAYDVKSFDTYGFDACGDKPMAAVFDMDETVIWNLGVTRYQSEQGKGFDPVVWDQWEETGANKVVAVPGAVAAFDRLRASGITIIINTNRVVQWAEPTAAALKHAGLGEFQHGSTLYLRGDGVPAGEKASSAKDGRRAMIAEDYCIVILAGDQLGDINDVFNAKTLTPTTRRDLVNAPAFDGLWGKGWFILPNPVYGPWEGATFDDIYPADTRWEPKQEGQ